MSVTYLRDNQKCCSLLSSSASHIPQREKNCEKLYRVLNCLNITKAVDFQMRIDTRS